MDVHTRHKALIQPLRRALYDYEPAPVRAALRQAFHADAEVHLAHPFEDLDGAGALYEAGYAPLAAALPDLERRDTIVIAGSPENGSSWVGCCGYYTGTFAGAWLDIPPTGRPAALRFHEFFRIEDECVVEMQALWDIPQMMMQASAWPMVPSLGLEWQVPAPATQDGLVPGPYDPGRSAASARLVSEMLDGLGRFAAGGVEAMRLEDHWHPRFSWYGPSGIGTSRGVAGFRECHQIPFLDAMPDRVASLEAGNLFADGDYVGFAAWPGMRMKISGGGWLGIAPSNQAITMRSLDFWRCEDGLIRENWVLVDLLHVYHQIGVDVLARLRELVGRTRPRA